MWIRSGDNGVYRRPINTTKRSRSLPNICFRPRQDESSTNSHLGVRIPQLVVSDFSGGCLKPAISIEHCSDDGCGNFLLRKLSTASIASTISQSVYEVQRGSPLDLQAEGLQMTCDGQLKSIPQLHRHSNPSPPSDNNIRTGTVKQSNNVLFHFRKATRKCLSQRAEALRWRKIRRVVQCTPFLQHYKKRYPWVQLAGHQGNFESGGDGTILKKVCGREQICLEKIMSDPLRSFVPQFYGTVRRDGNEMLQMQDLLADFDKPCVMDCKMGVRTYLEEELQKAREKPKLRKDMYDKMVRIDSEAPTDTEHRLKAVTKPRYMVWRETISSTASLGFRIEGVRCSDGFSSKDFKTTRTIEQVMDVMCFFTLGRPSVAAEYLERLKQIRNALKTSDFFSSHELIGSSLLFVHDISSERSGVWLIDFAKTTAVPAGQQLHHDRSWQLGNHEDGYLIGIDNLIAIMQSLSDSSKSPPNESLPS